MADITMCFNGCKLQDTCYRYKATANPYRQSYSDFKPDTNGVCEYYWHIETPKKSRGKNTTDKSE